MENKTENTDSNGIENYESDGNTSFLRAARNGQLEKVLEYLKTDIDINTSNANGLNALHLASKDGHVEIVEELLKRGAIVDAATKKGNTALHIASLAGQEEVVKLLVHHGASVNVQSQNGFTPLYMAAQENHDNVVKFLLANGANQSLSTEDGFTPLAVAMQQGHDKVVTVLLENDTRGKVRLPALHIAAKKDDVRAAKLLLENDHNPDVTSKSGFTPLHIASHYGNQSIANLLIQKGADVNYSAKHNITPLHVAAKWGKSNMVSLLLEQGAHIEAKTRDGLTPLHCAARSGHEQVVDMLLEKSAPISSKTKNGLAPLHMAAQGDHVDAARILLYHRAPVDEVTVDYLTALHVAAHCGHVRVAKLLLDRQADANARALNGFTPLHIACKKNRIKVVELLLKHGACIGATTESGLTPLHVASFMGCMNIVIYLLQHDASPDIPTVRGETPLHLAARANQTDIIRILLRNGAQVDARAREQQTPLHVASRLGNVDIVMLLLQHGAKIDNTTKDMYTSLHIAAKEGQDEVAAVLIENGASLNSTTKKGFTPLHLAAKYGHLKVAKLLVQKEAPVDAQGKNGVTPLHVASHYDHQNVALLLLDKGASPHANAKNGHTPLHIAARKNQMDIANTLLEYGAKPDVESKAGFTPLHLSSQEGHVEISSLLLEHRATPDYQSKNGLTPMHLCAQENKVAVAEILHKNGAEIETQTKGGYTPLHIACHYGQADMVKFLLSKGADVKATTSLGYTPLHQAAQQGHTNIVNLLLENSAQPNAFTNNGQTPLHIAQKLGYITVIDTLKEVTDSVQSPVLSEEKYRVVAPELMHETFLSDSEEEGEDTLLGDQTYRYLTADEMKSLGDDSLPIDVTRDERVDSNRMVGSDDPNAYPPRHIEDSISPEHIHPNYVEYIKKAIDNVDISKHPVNIGFLVSFLVDARGGAMRGCRHSGVRVIVPPRCAPSPTRITCRYVRPQRTPHPPPLMEGEALASRVLELGPVGAKFLGPVIIEVPHFAALRGKEREIVILRSDNGESWKEHTIEATEDVLNEVLRDSFDNEDLNQLEDTSSGRTTRIITQDFPQYFAVISRIRQEVHAIGPEGGMVSSTVVPQVQAVFPQGALTKKIKVGLQAQPIDPELTAKLLGHGVAVSPVVTVEPRRRKFHKAITLSMPAPRAHSQGMINQYSGSAPTLRLLCSITGGTSRAQWEDVTGSTPLTFVNDCVSFTTTVSARFWLMDCRNIGDATKMATELYREAIHVPFIAKFVVFAKRIDPLEARLRVFCMTDDKEEKTLEYQEQFTEIAKSRDVEVMEGKSQYIEFAGNLVPITKSGEQLEFSFRAFKENRLPFSVRVKDQHAEAVSRCLFMREPKVQKGEPPQQPICILNIVLPDDIVCETISLTDSESIRKKYYANENFDYYRQDPRLADMSNLLGDDWVELANQLGLTSSEINVIKSEYPDSVAKQAQSMLRMWLSQSGNRVQTNTLENALLRIGRDDIANQCLNVDNRNQEILRIRTEEKEKHRLKSDNKIEDISSQQKHMNVREEIVIRRIQDNIDKYSAEEKTFEPSDEEEDFNKTVPERREQIVKRLSTERTIPASSQRVEIVQEISSIKRQSLVEDKIAEVQQKTNIEPMKITTIKPVSKIIQEKLEKSETKGTDETTEKTLIETQINEKEEDTSVNNLDNVDKPDRRDSVLLEEVTQLLETKKPVAKLIDQEDPNSPKFSKTPPPSPADFILKEKQATTVQEWNATEDSEKISRSQLASAQEETSGKTTPTQYLIKLEEQLPNKTLDPPIVEYPNLEKKNLIPYETNAFSQIKPAANENILSLNSESKISCISKPISNKGEFAYNTPRVSDIPQIGHKSSGESDELQNFQYLKSSTSSFLEKEKSPHTGIGSKSNSFKQRDSAKNPNVTFVEAILTSGDKSNISVIEEAIIEKQDRETSKENLDVSEKNEVREVNVPEINNDLLMSSQSFLELCRGVQSNQEEVSEKKQPQLKETQHTEQKTYIKKIVTDIKINEDSKQYKLNKTTKDNDNYQDECPDNILSEHRILKIRNESCSEEPKELLKTILDTHDQIEYPEQRTLNQLNEKLERSPPRENMTKPNEYDATIIDATSKKSEATVENTDPTVQAETDKHTNSKEDTNVVVISKAIIKEVPKPMLELAEEEGDAIRLGEEQIPKFSVDKEEMDRISSQRHWISTEVKEKTKNFLSNETENYNDGIRFPSENKMSNESVTSKGKTGYLRIFGMSGGTESLEEEIKENKKPDRKIIDSRNERIMETIKSDEKSLYQSPKLSENTKISGNMDFKTKSEKEILDVNKYVDFSKIKDPPIHDNKTDKIPSEETTSIPECSKPVSVLDNEKIKIYSEEKVDIKRKNDTHNGSGICWESVELNNTTNEFLNLEKQYYFGVERTIFNSPSEKIDKPDKAEEEESITIEKDEDLKDNQSKQMYPQKQEKNEDTVQIQGPENEKVIMKPLENQKIIDGSPKIKDKSSKKSVFTSLFSGKSSKDLQSNTEQKNFDSKEKYSELKATTANFLLQEKIKYNEGDNAGLVQKQEPTTAQIIMKPLENQKIIDGTTKIKDKSSKKSDFSSLFSGKPNKDLLSNTEQKNIESKEMYSELKSTTEYFLSQEKMKYNDGENLPRIVRTQNKVIEDKFYNEEIEHEFKPPRELSSPQNNCPGFSEKHISNVNEPNYAIHKNIGSNENYSRSEIPGSVSSQEKEKYEDNIYHAHKVEIQESVEQQGTEIRLQDQLKQEPNKIKKDTTGVILSPEKIGNITNEFLNTELSNYHDVKYYNVETRPELENSLSHETRDRNNTDKLVTPDMAHNKEGILILTSDKKQIGDQSLERKLDNEGVLKIIKNDREVIKKDISQKLTMPIKTGVKPDIVGVDQQNMEGNHLQIREKTFDFLKGEKQNYEDGIVLRDRANIQNKDKEHTDISHENIHYQNDREIYVSPKESIEKSSKSLDNDKVNAKKTIESYGMNKESNNTELSEERTVTKTPGASNEQSEKVKKKRGKSGIMSFFKKKSITEGESKAKDCDNENTISKGEQIEQQTLEARELKGSIQCDDPEQRNNETGWSPKQLQKLSGDFLHTELRTYQDEKYTTEQRRMKYTDGDTTGIVQIQEPERAQVKMIPLENQKTIDGSPKLKDKSSKKSVFTSFFSGKTSKDLRSNTEEKDFDSKEKYSELETTTDYFLSQEKLRYNDEKNLPRIVQTQNEVIEDKFYNEKIEHEFKPTRELSSQQNNCTGFSEKHISSVNEPNYTIHKNIGSNENYSRSEIPESVSSQEKEKYEDNIYHAHKVEIQESVDQQGTEIRLQDQLKQEPKKIKKDTTGVILSPEKIGNITNEFLNTESSNYHDVKYYNVETRPELENSLSHEARDRNNTDKLVTPDMAHNKEEILILTSDKKQIGDQSLETKLDNEATLKIMKNDQEVKKKNISEKLTMPTKTGVKPDKVVADQQNTQGNHLQIREKTFDFLKGEKENYEDGIVLRDRANIKSKDEERTDISQEYVHYKNDREIYVSSKESIGKPSKSLENDKGNKKKRMDLFGINKRSMNTELSETKTNAEKPCASTEKSEKVKKKRAKSGIMSFFKRKSIIEDDSKAKDNESTRHTDDQIEQQTLEARELKTIPCDDPEQKNDVKDWSPKQLQNLSRDFLHTELRTYQDEKNSTDKQRMDEIKCQNYNEMENRIIVDTNTNRNNVEISDFHAKHPKNLEKETKSKTGIIDNIAGSHENDLETVKIASSNFLSKEKEIYEDVWTVPIHNHSKKPEMETFEKENQNVTMKNLDPQDESINKSAKNCTLTKINELTNEFIKKENELYHDVKYVNVKEKAETVEKAQPIGLLSGAGKNTAVSPKGSPKSSKKHEKSGFMSMFSRKQKKKPKIDSDDLSKDEQFEERKEQVQKHKNIEGEEQINVASKVDNEHHDTNLSTSEFLNMEISNYQDAEHVRIKEGSESEKHFIIKNEETRSISEPSRLPEQIDNTKCVPEKNEIIQEQRNEIYTEQDEISSNTPDQSTKPIEREETSGILKYFKDKLKRGSSTKEVESEENLEQGKPNSEPKEQTSSFLKEQTSNFLLKEKEKYEDRPYEVLKVSIDPELESSIDEKLIQPPLKVAKEQENELTLLNIERNEKLVNVSQAESKTIGQDGMLITQSFPNKERNIDCDTRNAAIPSITEKLETHTKDKMDIVEVENIVLSAEPENRRFLNDIQTTTDFLNMEKTLYSPAHDFEILNTEVESLGTEKRGLESLNISPETIPSKHSANYSQSKPSSISYDEKIITDKVLNENTSTQIKTNKKKGILGFLKKKSMDADDGSSIISKSLEHQIQQQAEESTSEEKKKFKSLEIDNSKLDMENLTEITEKGEISKKSVLLNENQKKIKPHKKALKEEETTESRKGILGFLFKKKKPKSKGEITYYKADEFLKILDDTKAFLDKETEMYDDIRWSLSSENSNILSTDMIPESYSKLQHLDENVDNKDILNKTSTFVQNEINNYYDSRSTTDSERKQEEYYVDIPEYTSFDFIKEEIETFEGSKLPNTSKLDSSIRIETEVETIDGNSPKEIIRKKIIISEKLLETKDALEGNTSGEILKKLMEVNDDLKAQLKIKKIEAAESASPETTTSCKAIVIDSAKSHGDRIDSVLTEKMNQEDNINGKIHGIMITQSEIPEKLQENTEKECILKIGKIESAKSNIVEDVSQFAGRPISILKNEKQEVVTDLDDITSDELSSFDSQNAEEIEEMLTDKYQDYSGQIPTTDFKIAMAHKEDTIQSPRTCEPKELTSQNQSGETSNESSPNKKAIITKLHEKDSTLGEIKQVSDEFVTDLKIQYSPYKKEGKGMEDDNINLNIEPISYVENKSIPLISKRKPIFRIESEEENSNSNVDIKATVPVSDELDNLLRELKTSTSGVESDVIKSKENVESSEIETTHSAQADIEAIERKLRDLGNALDTLEQLNETDRTEKNEVREKKLRRVERKFERMASETDELATVKKRTVEITKPSENEQYQHLVSQLSQDEVKSFQGDYNNLWDEYTFSKSDEWDSKTPDSQADVLELPQGETSQSSESVDTTTSKVQQELSSEKGDGSIRQQPVDQHQLSSEMKNLLKEMEEASKK